jgi:hypothetical protein|tara:strand:+ start:472 stop:747 length:276 start_codon:yes stop_codon:yes gene_type:complete
MPTKNNIEAIAEHHLVKILTPLLLTLVIGSVTFLFSSIIDLKNEMVLIESKKDTIEEKIDDLDHDMETVREMVTDLRINSGRERREDLKKY